jgi:catechol 2,3-dioxygenase-like lactoylglutathione lyase family enzyme
MKAVSVLDHASIAVYDITAAETFYDAIMAALGVAKVSAAASLLGYGLRANAQHPQRVYLSICLDPNVRHSSDHRHWCFKASSRAAVQAFHRAGLAAGGGDDGAPGLRPRYHPHYFAAFLRDPEGNRVEAVCHRSDAL